VAIHTRAVDMVGNDWDRCNVWKWIPAQRHPRGKRNQRRITAKIAKHAKKSILETRDGNFAGETSPAVKLLGAVTLRTLRPLRLLFCSPISDSQFGNIARFSGCDAEERA